MHECDRCSGKPGSDSARAQGCTCPVFDNGHGHNEHRLVMRADCPLHGFDRGIPSHEPVEPTT